MLPLDLPVQLAVAVLTGSGSGVGPPLGLPVQPVAGLAHRFRGLVWLLPVQRDYLSRYHWWALACAAGHYRPVITG